MPMQQELPLVFGGVGRPATICLASLAALLVAFSANSCVPARPPNHAPSLVFAHSDVQRTARTLAPDGQMRDFGYSVVDGLAIYQGDIILGPAKELDQPVPTGAAAESLHRLSFGIAGGWPGGNVAYCVSPQLPNPQRVAQAAAHWNAKTKLKFFQSPLCDSVIAVVFAHILFVPGSGCLSYVGMQPGPDGGQPIYLAPGCGIGETIHEMGHSIGLRHEQSRTDRDQYVTIMYANVIPAERHNFDIDQGSLLGAYDFGSVMHYGAYDFAINPAQPTIVTKPPGIPIGQRAGLSSGDIAAANSLYP